MKYTGIVVAGLLGSAMALPAKPVAGDFNPGGVEESPIAVPPQHLNQYGGYGLGPYLAGVPGVNPYSQSPSRTPSSMVTVPPTSTPMPSPTEAPTTITDVAAAEVQSSLSELEASKSSSESAASLSSSYSASAAAWTSAYNIMHIGRRDDEPQPSEETPIPAPSQNLNQYGGYGLGPYLAGVPGVNPYSQSPSRTPSSMVVVTVTVPPTSTPMPSPTEAPTTATDVAAAEVQSSLSELEASKSSSESAASLSSSYSASAAAWTSAYNIMHIGRRDDESQPNEDFAQGDDGNGPAASAATPTPEPLAAQ